MVEFMYLVFECGLLDGAVLILLFFFSHCGCMYLLQTQTMAELAEDVHQLQVVPFPVQSAVPLLVDVNVRMVLSQTRWIFLAVSTIKL